MATAKEWIRDFRKKPKWDQFLIMFTLIIGVGGLFVGGNYFINISSNNQQINLENSLYVGGNNYGTISFSMITNNEYVHTDCSHYYQEGFAEMTFHGNTLLTNSFPSPGLKNVLIKLPTNQEVFLEEVVHNKSYTVGLCNDERTDCCIYGSFRKDTIKPICYYQSRSAWNPTEATQHVNNFDPQELGLEDIDCKIYYS